MGRFLWVLGVAALLALAGCCGGKKGCGQGCGQPQPALGVSPKDCTFIEGGHGWR
jgi:hypothetical protein